MRPHDDVVRAGLGIAPYGTLAALIGRERRRVRPAILPPGVLAAADRSRLIGPGGSISCTRALLRSIVVLADGAEHPVEDLVAAGFWAERAALEAAAGAFELRLAAVGLRIVRGEGWRLVRT